MANQVKFTISNPVHFLALGFGSGLLKPAPGTWGTLAAVPLYYLLIQQQPSLAVYGTCVLLMFLVGIYLCGKTASDVGAHDHGAIVWDEIVGYFITMFALTPTAANMLLGFVLFRLFDILKPWPIRWLDKKVHGGFGIMIDDVIAGIAACGVLQLLNHTLLAGA